MKCSIVVWFCSVVVGLTAAGNCHGQHLTADEEFQMALTGDSIITRILSVYEEPEYLRMIELLRNADPALAKELTWAGIDMVSRANVLARPGRRIAG